MDINSLNLLALPMSRGSRVRVPSMTYTLISFARNKRDLEMLELVVITLNEHDEDTDIADEFEDDI